jgi:hypothetical protein
MPGGGVRCPSTGLSCGGPSPARVPTSSRDLGTAVLPTRMPPDDESPMAPSVVRRCPHLVHDSLTRLVIPFDPRVLKPLLSASAH